MNRITQEQAGPIQCLVQQQQQSTITDWAMKEGVQLASISTTLDGIVTGITALDVLIQNFQNSPATLSAGDQAALDAIVAASTALSAKASAISTTPPVPPAAS